MSKPNPLLGEGWVRDIDLSKVDDSIIEMDDLEDVVQELCGVAHQFSGLGSVLRIKYEEMSSLRMTHKDNHKEGLRKVITLFLQQQYNLKKVLPPSWPPLVAAVSNSMGGNNHALAKKIAKNHTAGAAVTRVTPTEETSGHFEDIAMKDSHRSHSQTEPTPSYHHTTHDHHKHHESEPTPSQFAKPQTHQPVKHTTSQPLPRQQPSNQFYRQQESEPSVSTQPLVETPQRQSQFETIREKTNQGEYGSSCYQGDNSGETLGKQSGTHQLSTDENSSQAVPHPNGHPKSGLQRMVTGQSDCQRSWQDTSKHEQPTSQQPQDVTSQPRPSTSHYQPVTHPSQPVQHRDATSLSPSDVVKQTVGIGITPAARISPPQRSVGRGRGRGSRKVCGPATKQPQPGSNRSTPPHSRPTARGSSRGSSQRTVGGASSHSSQSRVPDTKGFSLLTGNCHPTTPSLTSSTVSSATDEQKFSQTQSRGATDPQSHTPSHTTPLNRSSSQWGSDSVSSLETSSEYGTSSTVESSLESQPSQESNLASSTPERLVNETKELKGDKLGLMKDKEYTKAAVPTKYLQELYVETPSPDKADTELLASATSVVSTYKGWYSAESPHPTSSYTGQSSDNPSPTTSGVTHTQPHPPLDHEMAAPAEPPPVKTPTSLNRSSHTECADEQHLASPPNTLQPSLDSFQSDSPLTDETLPSAQTEEQQDTLDKKEEVSHKPPAVGSSVVSNVKSATGPKTYVGLPPTTPAKIENASLVSGKAGGVFVNSGASLTYHPQAVYKPPHKPTPPQEQITTPHSSNSDQHLPSSASKFDNPQLILRQPGSMAPSERSSGISEQMVDRPRGPQQSGGGASTMESILENEKVVSKLTDYTDHSDHLPEDSPQEQDDTKILPVVRDAALPGKPSSNLVVHLEPLSMPSNASGPPDPQKGESKHPSMTATPSLVGGSTEHGQCTSLHPEDRSPWQQRNQVRPSHMSMNRPMDVAGSHHIQPETDPEDKAPSPMDHNDEVVLRYSELHQQGMEGLRTFTDGQANKSFQSFEAFHLPRVERYKKKVELKFGLLCPVQEERFISSVTDVYPMKEHPHGLALIINNEKFAKHSFREGTELDAINLTMTFRYLGYDVEVHQDLTTKQMRELFAEIGKRNHSAHDSFVCCILTHGDTGKLIGSDSTSVLIETLTDQLCAANCPQLGGKPKLFFIQACRGKLKCQKVATDHDQTSSDSGSEDDEDRDETDAHMIPDSPGIIPRPVTLKQAIVRSLSIDTSQQQRVESDSKEIPDAADFFFGFATPSGHVAWRDLDHGSWYVSELCRALCTYSCSLSLVDIMTKVHSGVGDRYYYKHYKQAPETTSRLRAKVFF